MDIKSAGAKFKNSLSLEKPLQIVGTINAYTALLAEQAGFRAIYLSGAGVANASYGLPDLGITTLDNVLEDVRRITASTSLPLLVDIDTGWGHAFTIARAVTALTKAGAAGIHIEDQISAKRCGHRPGKSLVEADEMVDRIKAAVDAKIDPDFIIMARTDALASEGLEKAIDRLHSYIEAGAEMIFLEGAKSIDDYRTVSQAIKAPLLANMTEFGVTPLLTTQELAQAGVDMVLYPLSAFRAMSKAALNVYQTIRSEGTQQAALPAMQTREELYSILNYHQYENKLDELNKSK
ncbi:MAG TPA: methylisocitrate lyase [Gammaproteobacteria bacterium]|nr:methylisocitrate lyase [Gammaproteobacteria bacterium]